VAAGAGAPRAAAGLPDLHDRQLDRPRPPARRRSKKALGCQAIGRSRGGPGTKIHAIVEARGLPVEVVVTPGQVSDYEQAEALIEGRAGDAVIADKGYDADHVIDLIERQGSRAIIPPRRHRCTKPRTFDAALYRFRHRVEFFFNKLKQFRRVATRYEKTARNYLAMVQIGCIRIWAKSEAAS
jgi:transposase